MTIMQRARGITRGVSRMSRRLPYEKTGSPAYVRGTIEEGTAWWRRGLDGAAKRPRRRGGRGAAARKRRSSPKCEACLAGGEGARRVSPRKKMQAASSLVVVVMLAMAPCVGLWRCTMLWRL
jgi:hypothetical protein